MKTVATTHKNMDFDALASLTAVTLLYPKAQPILPKSINPNVKQFLSLHKDLFPWLGKPLPALEGVEQLLVVDTADWGRLQGVKALKLREDIEILVWDHHPQLPTIPADWICRDNVGANVTLMLRCMRAESTRISPIQATLLLLGLYEDTGQLSFAGTTAEDARAAAFLLEQGADLNVLNRFLRPAYDEKQKNVLFEMLQNAERRKINGYTISAGQISIKGHIDGLAVVVRMFRDIMNADAAFGIFHLKDQDKCIVIGRSGIDEINVGDLMRTLGGGGHAGAGSAMLRQVNPDAVSRMICELIEGNRQSSVQISDLMSFPVHTIPPETTMEEVARLLREKGCTGLPVVEGNQLVGIISRRDFAKIHRRSKLKRPVKAFMQRNVLTIEPGVSPLQAARVMVRNDVGRLPVVEEGRIIGIVTRSDVMHYFYDLLPE